MKSQLGFLDGVRGFMALWVVASHLIQRSNGPNIFLVKGGLAVDVFMLVSGILMAHNFYQRKGSEPIYEMATWRRFFIRRFFRIAPLYYLLFALALIFAAPLARMAAELPYGGHGGQREELPLLWDVFSHVTFIYGLFPATSSSNVLPDWSLSLEMQFYLAFPALLMLMQRQLAAWGIACIAVYLLANAAISTFMVDPAKFFHYPQPSLLPLKITCFAAGMLIVQVTHNFEKRLLSFALIGAMLVIGQRPTYSAIAIAVCAIYFYSGNHAQTAPAHRFGQTAAAWANKLLGSPIPKFLGDVSYGVYLTHFLLLFPILHWAQQNGWLSHDSAWTRFLTASALVTPPTLLIAWALHVSIEKPFIEYGRRLIKKTSHGGAPAPTK